MKNKNMIDKIFRDKKDIFTGLYGENDFIRQKKRYNDLLANFINIFKNNDFSLFSSPGRTELIGNHTDHNNGKVLAASVNLDIIAAASLNNTHLINIKSEGYKELFSVDINNLNLNKNDFGKTSALIKGVVSGFVKNGFKVEGFDAYISSYVPGGSGLSSSAAFEVLIAEIMNSFFNSDKISMIELAKIGQYAENVYFGKPCGLMDQLACAVGGVVAIDFKNNEKPEVKKTDYDFFRKEYNLAIVNTGGSHADLTADYASIPSEMKEVAGFFHKKNCRKINEKVFYKSLGDLRVLKNDRAILRVIHFLNENKRVSDATAVLKKDDLAAYFSIINDSGDSSWKLLQNCFTTKNVKEQNIPLALASVKEFLKNTGAVRVHGGGFAGTILCYIPFHKTESFVKFIEKIFGKKSVFILSIRNKGVLRII